MPSTVYKICERALWEEWQRSGVLHGSEIDLRDGFVPDPRPEIELYR